MTYRTPDGRLYPRPEPKLWDVRLAVLAAAMIMIAVALGIREAKAFGIVAGLQESVTAAHPAFRYAEALAMALGVALSAIMTLLYWDGQSIRSWEFIGLAIAGALEATNSYLSATIATGELAWLLGSRALTLNVLSIGGVVVWLVDGKILSAIYSGFKARHDEWDEAAQVWLNREITKAMRRQQRNAERSARETDGNAERQRGISGNAGRTSAMPSGIAEMQPGNAETETALPEMGGALPMVMPEMPILPSTTLDYLSALRSEFQALPFTVAEAEAALPVGERQCRNVLSQLQAAGFLRKEGSQYKIVFGVEE